ncbi:MAG: hypothetical protein NT150_16130 [Bacteroidetes bacterium]|nr:hypothetical protein [Bacteroidota bacterium]
MFLKILKNNSLLSYIIFAVLVIGFGFNAFLLPLQDNFFAFSDLGFFAFHNEILMRILFLSIWLLSAFWMNRIVTLYKLMDAKGGTLIFLFALLSFSFWSDYISLDLQVGLLFLLFCVDQFFAIYQSQGKLYQSLNLGLLFGIAVYFYFPLIILLPWLFMALGIVKSFQWRDIILPLLGALLPFYLYSVFQFFTDGTNILLTKKLIDVDVNMMSVLFKEIEFKPYWALAIFFLLLTLAYSYRVMDKLTVKIRMFYSILIWFSLFSIALLFFTKGHYSETVFLLLPMVFLGANYLNAVKQRWIFDFGILFYIFLLIYTRI